MSGQIVVVAGSSNVPKKGHVLTTGIRGSIHTHGTATCTRNTRTRSSTGDGDNAPRNVEKQRLTQVLLIHRNRSSVDGGDDTADGEKPLTVADTRYVSPATGEEATVVIGIVETKWM
jgi:hypothetical protein